MISSKTFRKLLLLILELFVIFNFLTMLVLYYRFSPALGPHYGAVYRLAVHVKDSILVQSVLIALIFFLLTAIGVVAICILYSHRIAGPLFKAKQYAAGLSVDLDSAPIRFRKKDVIHDLAKMMNETAHFCHDRKERIMEGLNDMEAGLIQLGLLKENDPEKAALQNELQRIDVLIKEELQKIK